jgi:ABC-type antimicrobial peptide transport system permease subunit
MLLLGAFGVLGLVLAVIGIYSVLSYNVKRQVQEIGIRLALGASMGNVLRLVLIEGLKPTLLGIGIGAVGALAVSRFVASLIYAVKPSDPLTFAGMALLLTAVALAACILPAYRATRVDPIEALRYE